MAAAVDPRSATKAHTRAKTAAADPTSSAPLTARGVKTRAHLVKAARVLFERRGYLDTNVGDIAFRARVAHGTFYTYFRSKEEIFSEVIQALLSDFQRIRAAEPRLVRPHGLCDVVERSNRGYLRAYQANSQMMAVLEQVATFNPRLAEVRRQTRRFWVDLTSIAIREWQEQGLVYDDVDASYAATSLGSMIDRSAYVWNVLGEPYDFETAVRQLTVLYCNALGIPYRPLTRTTQKNVADPASTPRPRRATKRVTATSRS